jgi:S1-C subfamily serine protease
VHLARKPHFLVLLSVAALALIPNLSSGGAAEQPGSIGSGFFVCPEGQILTAYHVVQGSGKLDVVLADGSHHAAKVQATNEDQDLAMLRVEGANFPAVKLGDSDKMGVLDYVVAIGYPLANIIGNSASAYEGKINAKRGDQKTYRFQIDAIRIRGRLPRNRSRGQL